MLASTDQSEIRHGVAILREVLEQRGKEPVAKSFLQSLDVQDGLWWGLGTSTFVHAVCFCSEGDVLSQWRGYSPNFGVAIGVDFGAMKAEAEKAKFGFGKMLYARTEQMGLLQPILDLAISRANQIFTGCPGEMLDEIVPSFLMEVGICLLKSMLFFKHEAFSSEREWRVMRLETVADPKERLFFRPRGGSVVPYIELAFEPSLIHKIRCSPGLWSGSSLYGVRRLAGSLGSHVAVTKSDLPL